MSKPIGPTGDSSVDGPVAADIPTAIERARAERAAIEDTTEILNEFQEIVADIPPGQYRQRNSGTPRVLSDRPVAGPFAVLDAFRETFGTLRDQTVDARADCLQLIAREFDQELADHLEHACQQQLFPPPLKAKILTKIGEAEGRYESAKAALDEEIESLEEIDAELTRIRDRLDSLLPEVGERVPFPDLVERYQEVDAHRSRLDELAVRRQSTINSRTGDKAWAIDHRSLTALLYNDLTSQYPALIEICDCASACREARSSLVLELGVAD